MCVIIVEPPKAELDFARAQRLWKVNPDGGGFAFFDDDNELIIDKSMKFQDFWNKLKDARTVFPDRTYLIHMRIGTHGDNSINNVHPFQISKKQAFAHNGIFHHVPLDKEKSDTRMFIDGVLKGYRWNWLDMPDVVKHLEDAIGWSKIVILNGNPRLKQQIYILNEAGGLWEDNMWFSSRAGVIDYASRVISFPHAQTKKNKKKNKKNKKGKKNPKVQGVLANSIPNVIQKGKKKKALGSGGSNKDTSEKDISDTWTKEWVAWRDILEVLRDNRYGYDQNHSMYWSALKNTWVCLICQSDVDNQSGICECDVSACVKCLHLAFDCQCKFVAMRDIMTVDKLNDSQWEALGQNLAE